MHTYTFKVKENREEYLRWLGEKLGLLEYVDWYKVKTEDFVANSGSPLLEMFRSPGYVVMAVSFLYKACELFLIIIVMWQCSCFIFIAACYHLSHNTILCDSIAL
jgi:hypothetical protein